MFSVGDGWWSAAALVDLAEMTRIANCGSAMTTLWLGD